MNYKGSRKKNQLTETIFNCNVVRLFLYFVFFCIACTSCTSYKNIPYFKDFPDTAYRASVQMQAFKSPVIKPDDLLSITIETVDPDITALLNSANAVTQAIGAANSPQLQTVSGYLVDKNGEVELPFAGKLKLEGNTTVEAREVVRAAMEKYIKDPIVNVKFSNFKVTVFGEVARPATYIMPTEKVTLFDALSQAGDLTIFGRRENVTVIRDTLDNKKNMVHLNLNSKDIISSPYFFLQPNDVVYVEPNESKARSTDAARNRNITIIASLLSIILVAVSRIR
ncbi:polysaccharide biosynthesis/export family protein [Parafilimonas terrae]|uniref:Polysaccharide export outer membrane protein n=1 Tax=Parafilimonas terrae TaxID=1465490 RepID=A0A1I5Z4H8_9BACT|nr:polysaccharide biosynthesis/export family protein [Parafilimonas terrae]SFQ51384.1 polysaccharide export outer membrane protein [Parafilimonas terrae]